MTSKLYQRQAVALTRLLKEQAPVKRKPRHDSGRRGVGTLTF